MKRHKHSLTHSKVLSGKMGFLIPLAWYEALPGDTIQQATSALIRCAPLVTPVMHPVHVRIHHWFVPNRIIWSNWENFITGGPNGLDTTSHPFITFGSGTHGVSTLPDYLGVPTATGADGISVNALPFRAYSLIWNEFFRDQDLQTPLTVSLGDGADTTTNTALQNVSWEKDYLTSSRPFEQKGPAVTLPLGSTAPVTVSTTGASSSGFRNLGTGAVLNPGTNSTFGVASGSAQAILGVGGTPVNAYYDPGNSLTANLAGAGGIDINVVRHAFAMQRFQEARARYGSRYVEYLRYLGIKSSDARLQRPEYLGGGKQTIQFSEVLQTAPTTSGTGGGAGGVGQFGGHGITAMRSNRYRRFFEEHGIVMTVMSVRPKTMYSQRTARKFLRGLAFGGLVGTKEDYWQRELQYIGQQQISGVEADATLSSTSTFGFQDRYDEYRREESSVHGLFRTTLDTWHLSREFTSAPALNSTFVSCVPSTRVFADTANDNLYVMCNHSIQARRLVAAVGTSMTF